MLFNFIPSTPPPAPWAPLGRRRSTVLARFLSVTYAQQGRLFRWYPNVAVPSLRGRTPVAALLLVWSGWDYAHGPCPRCKAPAYATSFNGALSSGTVNGCCTGCGQRVTRFVGGMARIVDGCQRATADSPWQIPFSGFPGGWTMRGEPRDLVALLQEVGAERVPNPRSRVFRS